MEPNKEAPESIEGRLGLLCKGIVSEENSVNYYQTLIDKTPENLEVNKGFGRMYYDLMLEERNHVARFHELISFWEKNLEKLKYSP